MLVIHLLHGLGMSCHRSSAAGLGIGRCMMHYVAWHSPVLMSLAITKSSIDVLGIKRVLWLIGILQGCTLCRVCAAFALAQALAVACWQQQQAYDDNVSDGKYTLLCAVIPLLHGTIVFFCVNVVLDCCSTRALVMFRCCACNTTFSICIPRV